MGRVILNAALGGANIALSLVFAGLNGLYSIAACIIGAFCIWAAYRAGIKLLEEKSNANE